MFPISRRSIGNLGTLTSETLVKSTLHFKWKYKLDGNVEAGLIAEEFKPRHHPGIIKPRTINLPKSFVQAILNTLEDQDQPRTQILKDSVNFANYLIKKKPPIEQDELANTLGHLKQSIIEKLREKRPDLVKDKDVIKSQMNNLMKKIVYNWIPVKYDLYKSLLYLVSRTPSEYAVLTKIFKEIYSRDPDWYPRSLFDFGSGIGCVTWAADSVWPEKIFEYFNVDASVEMNELAEHLLKKGRGQKNSILKGVFYRQFLPSSPTPYDLVVSAYTLMELPSLEARLKTIKNLWRKTKRYLVIVEQGTNAGYSIINEARDFILGLGDSHVFGPCPHDDVCPRFILNDGTPCNFEIGYYSLPFNNETLKRERYSYVVLKKGPRDNDPQWPRMVRSTLLRHKHCICNLCTKEGKIEQAVFSASKYGKLAYRCAKASDWGDRLPMNIKPDCQTPNDEPDVITPE